MLNPIAQFRRWRLSRYRIPESLWQLALADLPHAGRLPVTGQQRLRELVLMFLARKHFEGAAGLTITDRMRTSIALQACTLVLNLGLDWYRGWSSIVVYPGDFLVQREFRDEAGVVHRYADELSGESWPEGPVILSWQAVREATHTAQYPVLHEFAHKLDMLRGDADGFPPLHAGMDAGSWTRAFRGAYRRFTRAVGRGEEVRIDPYAAESPAEFFAVLSEVFFLDPALAHEEFPAVYGQLRRFYRQDPRALLAP